MPDPLAIDPSEVFPHLSRAPVVEAVINFRARASVDWQEQSIADQLKQALPDYPVTQVHRSQPLEVSVGQPERTELRGPAWFLQASSRLLPQIAVFSQDGFLLSRLKPYENWEQLSVEAMRLWRTFLQIAKPLEIQKMGVRFINRIELPPYPFDIADFICSVPQFPRNMPAGFISGGFFHQDIILVRGQPQYLLNLDKTIQPTASGQNPSLILDIDVSRTEVVGFEEDLLNKYLEKLRWLKNKLFFGTITDKVLEEYK